MSTHVTLPYHEITESPLTRATEDQLRILYTRYHFAAAQAVSKDVVEIACGAGVGLGMLASVSRKTVGGDIDERNCALARETYCKRHNIEILHMDALQMPFAAGSFDLAILFEALYYLPSADAFLTGVKGILRPGGKLLISTVNHRWRGFSRSPFCTRYYDAAELNELLVRHGFEVSLYGGFADQSDGPIAAAVGAVRKLAVSLHLIPNTQKSKEWLKRIFYGSLQEIPRELNPDRLPPTNLHPLSTPSDATAFRFLYAAAVLPK
jgi:SAM-dependent methyltransferase